MTEDIIRANIDESLFYFRKCRKRHKIFNILYIPFLILTICFIAFLVFVYAKLYFEAFDTKLQFWQKKSESDTVAMPYKKDMAFTVLKSSNYDEIAVKQIVVGVFNHCRILCFVQHFNAAHDHPCILPD